MGHYFLVTQYASPNTLTYLSHLKYIGNIKLVHYLCNILIYKCVDKVCPRSFVDFYIATGCIKIDQTSWTNCMLNIVPFHYIFCCTVCQRSRDQFIIVSYYIQRVKTSWTYSNASTIYVIS